MKRIEQLTALERQRDEALEALAAQSPFTRFLGVELQRHGDELTTRLRFEPKLIGSTVLPALHGGGTGAFLEITAMLSLSWSRIWHALDEGGPAAEAILAGDLPPLPKTVDLTIDYLRAGRARDVFARASLSKNGRRVSNIQVEAWQEERAKPIASAHGHFLLRGVGETEEEEGSK